MSCLKCFIIGKLGKIFPERCTGNFCSGRPRIISRLISFLISHSTLTEYSGFCCIPRIVHRNNRKTDVIMRQPYSANRAAKEKRHKFHRTITVSLRIRGLIIVHVHPAMPCQREKFMTPSSPWRWASKSYKRELFYSLLRVASIFCCIAYFRSLNNFLSFSMFIYAMSLMDF